MTYHNRYENRSYELSVSTGIARYDPILCRSMTCSSGRKIPMHEEQEEQKEIAGLRNMR